MNSQLEKVPELLNFLFIPFYSMNIWEKRANYLLLMTFKNLSNDEWECRTCKRRREKKS